MIVSKVRAELKVTIPDEVREALQIHEGDDLGFVLENGRVRLEKIAALNRDPFDSPFAGFSEWASAEDEAAFAHLQK